MAHEHAALYDAFWERSTLNGATRRLFLRRLEEYAATEPEVSPLVYPGADVPLRRRDDRLAKLTARRRSRREFAERPLERRSLDGIFEAFAAAADGSRPFPSAGATYATEVFALLVNVEGPLRGNVAYYNVDSHALSPVGPLPPWEECRDLFSVEGILGVPHVVVVLVLFAGRATAKYGERGGRFALLEAGHAAQSLAMRLVAERMVGVELGGLLDERVKRLLRLESTDAQIALGYACGTPRSARSRTRDRLRRAG